LPILTLALFFQILLTAEFAENAEETKSPSQLHQREFLHIKNLRALGVLGGKTTELALNWVCFHQVSNPIYFSYLLVIIEFAFFLAFYKLGLFFQLRFFLDRINPIKINCLSHIPMGQGEIINNN